MALGWRDAVATVLTGGAALIAYAKLRAGIGRCLAVGEWLP